MQRAIGFAALAILTVIPLLIVIAAANPAPHPASPRGWSTALSRPPAGSRSLTHHS